MVRVRMTDMHIVNNETKRLWRKDVFEDWSDLLSIVLIAEAVDPHRML